MKKNELVDEWDFSCLTKTFKIMRITLFLMLAALLQTFANEAYSQKTKLSLDYTNTRLEVVLDDIETLSEFFFLANEKLVDVDRRVDLSVKNKKIDEILDMLFAGTDVVYTITDRKIILAPSFLTEGTQQQQPAVSGTVTDESGLPLPGVTVVIKGTTQGTVTNADGNYSITNIPENATLVFSFVGMRTQEVQIDGRTTFTVVMEEETIGLDEVVAVGYGFQKKVNLTGAVSVMKGEEIENVPYTQASQALVGKMAGVTIQQTSGQPGKDQGTIRVRGLGTFSGAGNTPLVLIDGVPSSINDVNPNDIESISVLKDASSAAIYGSRAANGVILINTKRGREGVLEVEYNGYIGIQKAAALPEIMDSWIYAQMENEAALNAGRSPIWSEEEIELFRSGQDPENYPNANHYKYLMNSGSGIQTNHNIRFMGGSNNNNYNLSFGYLNQDGLIDKTFFERYNLHLNYNSKLSDKLNLRLVISGSQSKEGEPVSPGSQGINSAEGLISYAMKIPTTIAGKKSDGTYGNFTGFTIEGWMDSNSFREETKTRLRSNVDLNYDLSEAFTLHGVAGYSYNNYNRLTYEGTLQVDEIIFQGPAGLTNRIGVDDLLILQAFADYQLSIANHNITFLGGYSFEHFKNDYLEAYRDNFPNNELHKVNAGSPANMQNSGTGTEWGLQSYFSRINYNLLDRYLLEINARYDGSSRFPKYNRYGFFPSYSAGWIISEEEFFKIDKIDFLKLRMSHGSLGNQNIGNYPYQRTVNLIDAYPLGKSERLNPSAAVTTAPNTDIRWETTNSTNIGLETRAFNGKLDLDVDYFIKNTKDILYNISTSYILGLTPSEVNAGSVENRGWDFRIQHRNSFGNFSYNLSTNFSVVNNKVTELANLERDIERGLFVGYPLQSFYGYKVDGLFIDQNDIDNYPAQPYAAKPGEYRFMDLNDDGEVTAADDRTIIGNRFPKYSFGAALSAQYKQVDLVVQFRGLAGADRFINNEYMGRALSRGSNVQKWMYENRWTSEKPNPNATYPRMLVIADGVHMWPSDYWIRSAAFARIDNIQLGYTLPSNIVNSIGVKNLYVYANVRNLLTFSNYFEGWDPETDFYPPMRVITTGINIKF